MSWSIEVTGTKAAAAKRVAEQLDKVAATYDGKEEAKDVLVVKERILGLVEALDLTSDGYTDWNAVRVNANGSQSTNGKGVVSASFQVTVSRMSIALDGPLAAPADAPSGE